MTAASVAGASALIGVACGLGLWTLLGALPRFRRADLIDRVAPFLQDVSEPAREHMRGRIVDPLPLLGAFASPLVARLRTSLDRVLGGASRIRLALRQSGSEGTLERFRLEQLAWGSAALGIGVIGVVLLSATRGLALPGQIALPLVCALGGVLLRDRALRWRAAARMRRIASEFPTVLEFLTLSLSAGEGVFDGIRRVVRASSGELARELDRAVVLVGAGVPVADALERVANELGHPPLVRTVDHIRGALERGAPLADVLRAQAADARDAAKRELLESAGRREIAMLVPLIMLVLPITIIFALYPGLFVIRSGL